MFLFLFFLSSQLQKTPEPFFLFDRRLQLGPQASPPRSRGSALAEGRGSVGPPAPSPAAPAPMPVPAVSTAKCDTSIVFVFVLFLF